MRKVLRRVGTAMVIAGLLAAGPMVGRAQEAPRTCPADTVVPDDGFASGGLGLTCVEMEERYGPGQVGQSSIYYEVDGVQVHIARGGLSLSWPRQSATDGVDEEVARDFALQFLPNDADLRGSLDLGGVLHPFTELDLYESDDLEDRFEDLNEPYSGDFVVVYTYAADGMERGDVTGVEIMPVSNEE